MNGVVAYVRDFLDGLVAPVAAEDEAVASAHRAFIGGHLLLALAGLAALPLRVALTGAPGLTEALTFAWLAAPLGAVLIASRTGDLGLARFYFVGLFTGFVVWVAELTGGASSGAIVWLAVVPIEASLANSRRVTAFATALAVVAWLGLVALSAIPFLPREAAGGAFARLLPLAGLLYAALLGFRLDWARRRQARLTGGELVRYRLMAEASADMITQHGSDGAVLFASPAVASLIAAKPEQLRGGGLLDRIHIGDRPAWLTALGEALARRRTASASVRMRIGERNRDGSERFATMDMRCQPAFDPIRNLWTVVALSRPGQEAPEPSALSDVFASPDSAYDRVVPIAEARGKSPPEREDSGGARIPNQRRSA